MMETTITLDQLKEIFEAVFGTGLEYTFNILILLTDSIPPKEITQETLDSANGERVKLYNKLKKLHDEAIHFEQLCTDNLRRSIRP